MGDLKYWETVRLTIEEEKQAIEQAKIRKYFHEKNAAYWAEQEKIKGCAVRGL